MIQVSNESYNAITNSLLQALADQAYKTALTAGQLADANVTIARLMAEIAEIKRSPVLMEAVSERKT